MKKILGLIGCLFLVVAFVGIGLAGSEMGAKMDGNLSGEIVKISGEMVDVKDSTGKIHSIHRDPKTTTVTGERCASGDRMLPRGDHGIPLAARDRVSDR